MYMYGMYVVMCFVVIVTGFLAIVGLACPSLSVCGKGKTKNAIFGFV